MKTVIITRHPGALKWLRKHHPEYKEVEHIVHAKPEDIEGNIVIGMLPIHMAVLAKEYWNLSLNIPAEMRGKELTVSDMEKYNCKIEQYKITKV